MELIEKLEESVLALTTEIIALRKENKQLRDEVASSQAFLEQNYALEEQLKQEKEARSQASVRIEKLLGQVHVIMEEN